MNVGSVRGQYLGICPKFRWKTSAVSEYKSTHACAVVAPVDVAHDEKTPGLVPHRNAVGGLSDRDCLWARYSGSGPAIYPITGRYPNRPRVGHVVYRLRV